VIGTRAFAYLLFAILSAPAQPVTDLGVYIGWVSTVPGDPVLSGADLAKRAGFHTIRLPLENLTAKPSPCSQSYWNVIADPAFTTIFLTTWGDSNSYDPCSPRNPRTDQRPKKLYLQKSYYTPENRERMRAEYSNLAYRLAQADHTSRKTFVISNWEGDNELYCDAAALFAIDPAFRTACEAQRKTEDVLDAYRTYLTLRHQGIADGVDRAKRAGFTGVPVLDMIEFSSLRMLKEKGLPDMLDTVIPNVPATNFIGYSAWESLGDPLFADLKTLKKSFGSRFLVGEFGFDRGLLPDAPARAAQTRNTISEAGIPYAFLWQIADQPPLEGLGDKGLYGLYDKDRHLTTMGAKLLHK
jgi:hypothetical protein